MAKPLSIDELFAKIEEAEGYKQQAIEQLLAEIEERKEKLAKLGYTGDQTTQKVQGKKRHRRTKAELAAAREGVKTAELPNEPEGKRRTQKLAEGSEAHG